MERPCAWKKYTPQQVEELEELCRGYKQFLSENKTERLCVKTGIKMAEEAGYVDLETVIAEGRELKAGDKVYAANHGKDLMLVNLGNAPLEQGFNILGAHVDSPRLDLKQNPAFEAGDMAYLDTHYYGGVKSYHWVASPLALVGVICKKDGTTVDINIGDKADDPVFTISDLLIHLSSEQMSKPAKDAVDAEILDVIVGGRPVKFDEDDKDAPKEPVKQMFLDILKVRRRGGGLPLRRDRGRARRPRPRHGPRPFHDSGLWSRRPRLRLPLHARPDQCGQCRAHEHHAHRRQRGDRFRGCHRHDEPLLREHRRRDHDARRRG